MITITITNLKGGTGKSTITILTANYLASLGNRVLVIDFDLQNSTSFFYLDDYEEAEKKNLARALYDDDLPANIITSNYPGVLLIPSSLSLVDLRAINEHRFSRLMGQLESQFDFVLIDTAPAWDNLTLNAIHAADLVMSPVRLSSFDHNTAHFMKQKILQETELYPCSVDPTEKEAGKINTPVPLIFQSHGFQRSDSDQVQTHRITLDIVRSEDDVLSG